MSADFNTKLVLSEINTHLRVLERDIKKPYQEDKDNLIFRNLIFRVGLIENRIFHGDLSNRLTHLQALDVSSEAIKCELSTISSAKKQIEPKIQQLKEQIDKLRPPRRHQRKPRFPKKTTVEKLFPRTDHSNIDIIKNVIQIEPQERIRWNNLVSPGELYFYDPSKIEKAHKTFPLNTIAFCNTVSSDDLYFIPQNERVTEKEFRSRDEKISINKSYKPLRNRGSLKNSRKKIENGFYKLKN